MKRVLIAWVVFCWACQPEVQHVDSASGVLSQQTHLANSAMAQQPQIISTSASMSLVDAGKMGHVANQASARPWRATLDATGRVELATRAQTTQSPNVHVALASVGRVYGPTQTVRTTSPGRVEGAWMTYTHDHGIKQWYHNKTTGLEHGFVLSNAPQGQGEVVLTMSIDGGVVEQVSPDRIDVHSATTSWRYDTLKVWDATGRPLYAKLSASSTSHAQLIIDDSQAIYPITVDPTWNNVVTKSPWVDVPQAYAGRQVALSTNTAIVGAEGFDANSGAVYIYRKRNDGTWFLYQTLVPEGIQIGDRFGSSLATSGDHLIIGAKGNDDRGVDAGAVYAYRRNAQGFWYFAQKIYATNAATGEEFGASVDVDGNRFVAGASKRAGGGAALMFRRNQTAWQEDQQLRASDASANDGFGSSVSLNGNRVAVGAPNKDATYIYERTTTWGDERKLIQTNNSLFGASLSLSATHLAIGAPNTTFGASGAGTVYIYDTSTWNNIALNSAIPTANGHFGQAVAMDGANLLVGTARQGSDSAVASYQRINASTWSFLGNFNTTNRTSNDSFGLALAIDGDMAIVGAPDDAEQQSRAGASHIFSKSNNAWANEVRLDGAMIQPNTTLNTPIASFGDDVALSGDYAVVGAETATLNAINSGVAYVYRYISDKWILHQVLLPETIEDGSRFGCAVDIQNDRLAVAARKDRGREVDTGTTYVYERQADSSWLMVTKVFAPDGKDNDDFGGRVEFSGDSLIVGAEEQDDDRGAAYVFVRTAQGQWTWQATLKPNTLAEDDRFGSDVSISGDTAIVGAINTQNERGAAYLFERTGQNWTYIKKFTRAAVDKDGFGKSVSVDGVWMAISARGVDDYTGIVYLYQRDANNEWQYHSSVQEPNKDDFHYYGNSLKISGNHMIVGAPTSDVNGKNEGAVYIYRRGITGWALVDNVTMPGVTEDGRYGWAVDIEGSRAIAGASESGSMKLGRVGFFQGPISAPPVVDPISALVTDEEQPVTFTVNATDPDGDSLSYGVSREPQHGTVSGSWPMATYTPDMDFAGTDIFLVAVSDGIHTIDVEVTVNVTNINDAPSVALKTIEINEDEVSMGNVDAVDPDMDTIEYSVKTAAQHGTFNLNESSGNYTYTPDAEYSGADEVTITVTDGTLSGDFRITITINVVDDAPVGDSSTISVVSDISSTITVKGADLEGDAFTFELLDEPANGKFDDATFEQTGQLTYTPNPGATSDTFTYRLIQENDNTITSPDYTITIEVDGVSIAILTPTMAEVLQDNITTITGITIPNQMVTISLVDQFGDQVELPGADVISDDQGGFTYTTPAPLYNGPYTLTCTSADKMATSTFTVLKLGIKQPSIPNGILGDKGIVVLPEGERAIIQGSGPAGATTEVFLDDSTTPLLTVPVGPNGVWQVILPTNVGDGPLNIRVVVTSNGEAALLRIKALAQFWKVQEFERQGCQQLPGQPPSSVSLLLFAAGFICLRRRTRRQRP